MSLLGQEYNKVVTLNQKSDASFSGGNVKALTDVVTFASQASGATITLGGIRLPEGAVVLGGQTTTDTSTGSATFSIGITGTTAKYRALAAQTTTGVPAPFGVTAALGTSLTAPEQIIITTAAATAPASGRMVVTIFYTVA